MTGRTHHLAWLPELVRVVVPVLVSERELLVAVWGLERELVSVWLQRYLLWWLVVVVAVVVPLQPH